MREVKSILVAVLTFFIVSGCGGSGDNGPVGGDKISVSGRIMLTSPGSQGVDNADGARITAVLDRNSDGQIGEGERATAEADDKGQYSIDAPAEKGRTTIVTFEEDGYAKMIKTIVVNTLGDVRLDGTLMEMDSLVCENGACRDEAGRVSVKGIEVSSGYARVFNPVTDADRFPGSFADDQGNMLISAVFGAFDLRDENDEPIEQLGDGQSATITMRVPRDTWGSLVDISPGDDRVSVPMYYFDETSGQWVMQGTGWLEDAGGQIIVEGDLMGIREGSYSGTVYAVAEVTHFSFWNVDWPVEDNTCISGVIVDEDDEAVAGASGVVRGFNFAGASPPFTTGENGEFCIDVRRSEKDGEDLDGNGLSGEKLELLPTFDHDGKTYRFEPVEVSTEAGTCPDGCMQMGQLRLSADNEVQPGMCTISGTIFMDGAPVQGVVVYVEDELMDQDQVETICGGNCIQAAYTGADGSYEVSTAYTSMLVLAASFQEADAQANFFHTAKRTFLTCPEQPVDLHVEIDSCYVQLPVIDYNAGSEQISWDPPVSMESLSVLGMGSPRWQVFSEAGFGSPVTYGQVPTGARQIFPTGGGSPTPVQSGDSIIVFPLGGFIDYQGFKCYSMTNYIVP